MAITNTYMILTSVPAVEDACWGDVIQGFTTARKSLAETECIVKWQGTKPASLPANTEYDHAGILAYLVTNTADWDQAL